MTVSSYMKSDRVKYLLLKHRYAIFATIIVACIAGLPQIMVRSALGPADRGVPYLVNDSEGEYLARVQEILDGHWSVSSPMLYEYKDSVALVPPTGEFIFYALPVKLTGFSLSTVVFLSKFLYPALLFLLSYLFIFSLLNKHDSGAQFSAIIGALLITIGYDAYDYRHFVSYIIQGTPDSAGLLWNRLVNPVTGAVLLFGFLWLLSLIVKKQTHWLMVGISGLVLAAMSGYIFSFALGLTIPVLIGLYFVWRKNWPMVLRVYATVVIALALNASYFVSVFSAMSGNVSLSDPRKAGMFLTHEPLINLISLASLIGVAVCCVMYFRKDISGEQEKRWWFFSFATVIASELVYNQQLITGRTVWPQHFVQYTIPLSMAMMAVFLHNIFRAHAKYVWRAAAASLLVIAVLFGWRGFKAASQDTIPKYTELQSYSEVFDYLNMYAPKDCVVYVSVGSDYTNQINRFIPALTSCNVYHTYYVYSGVPAERIMHNYLVDLRLRGIRPEEVKGFYFKNPFFTTSYFFRDWNDMLCNNMSGCGDKWLRKIADREEIDQWFTSVEKDVEQKYTKFLREDFYSELTRFRLDYFVVDTDQRAQINEKNFPFLSLRGTFGQLSVYAVVPPKNNR